MPAGGGNGAHWLLVATWLRREAEKEGFAIGTAARANTTTLKSLDVFT